MNEPTLDADRVRFESMTRTDNGLDLKATDEPGNGVILAVAAEMGRMLGDATNYVECEVTPNAGSDLKPMTMTIRYRSRPTPHELRRQAEAERDALRTENVRLLAAIEAVETLHRPTRVYDECDHDDCQAEQIEVYDYRACADSQIGWGCETCCYDGDMPIEDCPHGADHQGVAEADSCPTRAAVRAYRTATTGEARNG